LVSPTSSFLNRRYGDKRRCYLDFRLHLICQTENLMPLALRQILWTPPTTLGTDSRVSFFERGKSYRWVYVCRFRCSAACAYYTPFADQPNFTVLTNATVTRILFSKTLVGGKIRATAVEYVSNGQTHQAPIAREVIVSAGTIGTPKVMELSGVGNATYVLTSSAGNDLLWYCIGF
jgi:hypothetical protein